MLSKPIYDSLPFIYIALATFALFYAGHFGLTYSLLFFCIAAYVLHLRKRLTTLILMATVYLLTLIYAKAHNLI